MKWPKELISLLNPWQVTVLVILILAIFTINAFWFLPTKTELDANTLVLHSAIAVSARNQIRNFILRHQELLENFTFTFSAQPEELKELLTRTFRENPAIESIAILGVSGRELKREERGQLVTEKDLRFRQEEAAFQQAKAGKSYISPVFISKFGEPLITISFPLNLKTDIFAEDTQAVVANIRVRFIIDVIRQINVGEQGLIYIVDNSGFLVAHPDTSLVLQRISLLERNVVRRALEGERTSTFEPGNQYRNFVGEKVFALGLPLEIGFGWGVVVEQPESEVFSPQRRILIVAVLSFAIELLFLLILFTGYLRLLQTAENLRRSQSELQEAKTSLGIRVQARTKELQELTEKQEETIKERTKELQNRLLELEKFQRLAVGRELKMIELKKNIKKLEKEIVNYGGKNKKK